MLLSISPPSGRLAWLNRILIAAIVRRINGNLVYGSFGVSSNFCRIGSYTKLFSKHLSLMPDARSGTHKHFVESGADVATAEANMRETMKTGGYIKVSGFWVSESLILGAKKQTLNTSDRTS